VWTLCGNYVNFGVFALYGDTALSNALSIGLKLSLSISLDDRMAFPKLTKAYFAFIDTLCCNHTSTIAELETPIFIEIVHSLKEGLCSVNLGLSSQCCSAIDHIATFFFNNRRKDSSASRALMRHLTENPDLFPSILDTLVKMVLFEDWSNQYSISRPLLSLLLTHPERWNELKNRLIASQPPDRQEQMKEAFEKLMSGNSLQDNLEQKNRDKFTQNLTIFRHEVKRFIK